MNALTSKLNKSVKFIIALGVFAFIFLYSSNDVKADTFYPTWFRGYSGVVSGSYYTYSPFNSTDDYLQYYVFAQYPYFYNSYIMENTSVLNLLVNHTNIGGSSCSFIYIDGDGSYTTYSLSTGTAYSLLDYYGNQFVLCHIGDTLTITVRCNSNSAVFFGFYFGDISTANLTIYNNYYISGDSSGGSSSVDYTSILSSIYNQLVGLNGDTDTMLTYLNTIINNLVSLNSDTDTIITELQTINALIGSSTDAGTVLYYLSRISSNTAFTINIYGILNSWYNSLTVDEEDTTIDEEIESMIADVGTIADNSSSEMSGSVDDIYSANEDYESAVYSAFNNFDSSFEDTLANVDFATFTGISACFTIFYDFFTDLFVIGEFNLMLYVFLIIGIIVAVLGIRFGINKHSDSSSSGSSSSNVHSDFDYFYNYDDFGL